MRRFLSIVLLLPALAAAAFCADAPPKSLDPRLEIRMFAESPRIVTPTGIDVDHRGRVWAIESNTHFPPKGYRGHASDRVLVFRDDDRDGSPDAVETFADGLVHAMSIAVRPEAGVYVATRKEVILFTDRNDDGKADERRVVLRLDTPGDYPHNGLAGLAFDGLDFMYIGLGENLGAAYRLVGTDGRSHSGGGEGGSIFRCRPDGSDLTLWATGYWNPHASCVDAFGRLFSVDNDPDSRPPCRLLHVIPGGDYGYRFRNGRKGVHPFTAWDGELPGTLPMVAGTGEAPSGIVAYESDGLPEEFRGDLFVTSWGDHRIDRFRLRPRGTSFISKAEPLIVGGENFRPVGLAIAPDGSLFATDWVLKDYSVHGKGRIWRIAPVAQRSRPVDDLGTIACSSPEILKIKLASPRLDIRRAAARTCAERDPQFLESCRRDATMTRRTRMEAEWAIARRNGGVPAKSPHRSSLKNVELALLWPDLERPDPDRTVPTLTGPPMAGDALLTRLARPASLDPPRELLRFATRFGEFAQREPGFLEKAACLDDPFVFAAVVQSLADVGRPEELARRLQTERTRSPHVRVAILLAARQLDRDDVADAALAVALRDPDFGVRRAAVQWAAEAGKQRFRTEIERQLSAATTTADLFEAALAALAMLDGVKRAPKDESSGADYALGVVRDEHAAPDVRALALRFVPPNYKGLDVGLLKRLLNGSARSLRFEALRTLCETTSSAASAPVRSAIQDGAGTAGADAEVAEILRRVAADDSAEESFRREAISGLAAILQRDAGESATVDLLGRLSNGTDRGLQIEAVRALRRSLKTPAVRANLSALAAKLPPSASPPRDAGDLTAQLALAFRTEGLPLPREIEASETPRPQTAEEWIQWAADGGDADAGRRIFEHPNAGGCFRCHTINGRGGNIGPDLSVVARTMSREKLAESIVRPSKEISPQFTAWSLLTASGKTVTGLILTEDRAGRIQVGTPDGTVMEIDAADVEERRPQTTSVMPEKLVDTLTIGEFRDLVAFLATRK